MNIQADNKTWLVYNFSADQMTPWKERGINDSRRMMEKMCQYPTVYVYFGAESSAFCIEI